MSDFKKIKIKKITQWHATSVSITHMSSLKKIKIKIITQWRATSASRGGQGCFVENLHIIGLESKLLFYRGVNRNSPKLQGVKTY